MRRSRSWPVVVAAAALALSGCTAGSSSEAESVDPLNSVESPTATPPSDGDPDRRLMFAVVTHGTAGDPFWDVVKTGAEEAGAVNNADVDYQADPEPGGQAQLVDAATSSEVDGLIVSMADTDALQESITAAVAAGIPVVTINAGEERSQEFGALTHVGQSESSAGQGAGVQLRNAGVTKLLCVIHEAGNLALEERCQGAATGLGGQGTDGEQLVGNVRTLQVNASNIAETETTIASELQADPAIDGVLTLNPAVAAAAADAIDTSGSTAPLATFDLSPDVVQGIRDGQILFAVDQQQYLQGYLPVVFLALYARNGNVVGGGQPVPTGPRYITTDNVDTVEDLASNGTR